MISKNKVITKGRKRNEIFIRSGGEIMEGAEGEVRENEGRSSRGSEGRGCRGNQWRRNRKREEKSGVGGNSENEGRESIRR